MNNKENINIVYVNINNLKFAEYNPRKANKEQISQVKQSLERFGFVDPVILNSAENRKNVIIGGHLRCKVAKDMGIKKIPAVYLNIPDIEKEKELNLRLNKNTGEWDFDLLANFDIELLKDVGFENELNDIFDFNLETEEDDFDVESELEKIEEVNIKQGDLFQLGEHRLLCGDATNEGNLEKLINRQKIDFICCDPPYNIGLDYSKRFMSKMKTGSKGLFSDNKSIDDYYQFIDKVVKIIKEKANNIFISFWCDENYIWLIQDIFIKNGIKLERVGLWIKNNFTPTPQKITNKIYEPLVIGSLGKVKLDKKDKKMTEILNKEFGKSSNEIINYFIEYFNNNFLLLEKRVNNKEQKHTTQKPITLYEKIIKKTTQINSVVLDCFGGSGSTMIACEQLKRRCYAIELDPVYCQLIINRWEKLTGKKAIKIN